MKLQDIFEGLQLDDILDKIEPESSIKLASKLLFAPLTGFLSAIFK